MIARAVAAVRRAPLLIVPVFVLVYGYGTIDVADYYALSARPFALNPDSAKQFLHSSPLPFLLGYPLTHLLGPRPSFLIVMGAGLVFCLWALQRLAVVRYGARQGDAALMLLTTPLLIVLTQYIGKSDAWVAGGALLLPTLGHPPAQAAVAVLMILAHSEMGMLILASLAFLGIVRWRTAIIGAAIGVALVLGYHHLLLPSPPQLRAGIGLVLLRESIESLLATPVLHALFTFGAFWLCVWMAQPMPWRWMLMTVATAALASVTLDFTRVFTLVGLPVAIAVVDRLVARLDAAPDATRGSPWLNALPLLTLTQAHLIGRYVYDSRVPEIVVRWLGGTFRH